jgi:hypothetical protein
VAEVNDDTQELRTRLASLEQTVAIMQVRLQKLEQTEVVATLQSSSVSSPPATPPPRATAAPLPPRSRKSAWHLLRCHLPLLPKRLCRNPTEKTLRSLSERRRDAGPCWRGRRHFFWPLHFS